MRTTTVSILMFLASFLLQSNAFGLDFNAHLFEFNKSTYSLVKEREGNIPLRLGGEPSRSVEETFHRPSSFTWNIQFGYAGKNEASESVFFDQSGKSLFVQPRKQMDPYENKNLQYFLRSQEKSGVNFQLVYLFPYFHAEGKLEGTQYSLQFAQVGSVTVVRCEWKF